MCLAPCIQIYIHHVRACHRVDPHNNQLSVSLIAQLAEHHRGQGSSPRSSLDFSGLSRCCLGSIENCKDHTHSYLEISKINEACNGNIDFILKTSFILELLNYIDTTVDPCEDFFNYACGGWIKRNPLPDKETIWNQFSKLEAEVDEFVRDVLESKEIHAKYSKV